MLKTSLSKIALTLIVIYAIVSIVMYLLLQNYNEQEAYKRIRIALNYDKAIQKYVSDYQKPTLYALMEKNVLSKDYFDPILLSSTFIVQHVNEFYVQNLHHADHSFHVNFKFASDNPTNITNKANPFESKILKLFNDSNISYYTQHVNRNGIKNLFYALPVERNTEKCMRCHGDPKVAPKQMLELYGNKHGFHEKVGDSRAIIALYTPIDSNNEAIWYLFISIELLAALTFGLIYGIIYYYSRTIRQKDAFITKQSKFAAMGEMIGMIAHQWRQPLTGMGMTVDNLKLDIELQTIDEEKWMSNLEQVTTQIHYLSHTIDDFRNFFKPNQETQDVNVTKLMDESLQVIDSSLRSNHIAVIKNYSENCLIVSYHNDIIQVLLNIVKNAIDAYVENNIQERPLYLNIQMKTAQCLIEIVDEAGGIPDDIIDDIFNPYFSTKDEKNGTGLGLYMSKMIVEDHLNGTLDVTTADGKTHFIITLPDKINTEMKDGN